MSDKISLINRLITYTFYAIFAVTPLIMFPTTHEIFEFNKMWFVFSATLIIAFLWATKMILTRTFTLKRTPLDIPILIFLLSQIIATIFSIDPYVSWWGYYSRFNGGLLSTITYIFLYFALTTHLFQSDKKNDDTYDNSSPLSIKILLFSLFGGIAVALWGLPSHFGLDPTCLVFGRGLSTECWTDAFKPTIRIFSTLGQPNWLAAYLASLIPISIAFASLVSKPERFTLPFMEKLKLISRQRMQLFFALTTILFFIDLLYTRSKSGYAGFWIGLAITLGLYLIPIFYRKKFNLKKITTYPTRQTAIVLTTTLLLLTFIIGIPIQSLEKYTLQGLIQNTQKTSQDTTNSVQNPVTGDALGGTDSGDIRLIVWEGAVDVVRDYPLFGSGPETFGYIYYKYRPSEHNLTSEWDYLYNKAHNEYLNYAATSGLFGLLSYLSLIVVFTISALMSIRRRSEYKLVALALLGGYASILVSNFFGFSVVNTNLFLFLFPALFFSILKPHGGDKTLELKFTTTTPGKTSTILIVLIALITLFFQFKLLRMWSADQQYALGSNLNTVGEVVQANEHLENAVSSRPQEDLFKNELSLNLATLAYATQLEGNTTQASTLATRAKELSDEVTSDHPYNVVFYKTRTRAMYALAQINPEYISEAVEAIEHAKDLAPTDAKISYNVGIMYSQAGMYDKALEEFDRTIELKPDYREPYYATALVSTQAAEENSQKSQEYTQKAKNALQILLKMNPQDTEAQDLLNSLE